MQISNSDHRAVLTALLALVIVAVGCGSDDKKPTEPAPATGACCFISDGSCSVMTEQSCIDQFGDYEGNDTACDPNPCPSPGGGGACCFQGGWCGLRNEVTCAEDLGQWEGEGTVCDPNPCSASATRGACCQLNGICTFETNDRCNEIGGAYNGDDVPCNPDPCPGAPQGACCFEGGRCVFDIQSSCTSQGGIWRHSRDCNPNPCPIEPATLSLPVPQLEVETGDETANAVANGALSSLEVVQDYLGRMSVPAGSTWQPAEGRVGISPDLCWESLVGITEETKCTGDATFEYCLTADGYSYTATYDGVCLGQTFESWLALEGAISDDGTSGGVSIFELNETTVLAEISWSGVAPDLSSGSIGVSISEGERFGELEWMATTKGISWQWTSSRESRMRFEIMTTGAGYLEVDDLDDGEEWWLAKRLEWSAEGSGDYWTYAEDGMEKSHHSWGSGI